MSESSPDRVLPPVVASLDTAWTALSARLEGLTDEELTWEPVDGCWTVREVDGAWTADWADPDPVPAPVTTITWRLWHLAVAKQESGNDQEALDLYLKAYDPSSPSAALRKRIIESLYVKVHGSAAGLDEKLGRP